MSLLLNWRVWAALAMAAGLAFSHFTVYRKGAHDKQLQWTASVASANAESQRLERARQSRVDDMARASVARQAGLRVDAAGAGDAMQRLRDEVAARRMAEDSAASANQRAATFEQLFLESAEALRGMAATCDRHASDVRLLLDAWPQ